MKDLFILKNRSDIGAGTRGADMGIDAMEIAAITAHNDYFNRIPYDDIDTHNESVYNKVNNLFAKRINDVKEQCQRLCDGVKARLKDDRLLIVLSGDHSSALGTISGIKAHDSDKKIGVIWVDAHADLHSPYSSPSGNIHGMPLAASLNYDNRESLVNEIGEATISVWEKLKNIGVEGAKIAPENLIFFGVRDTEDAEDLSIDIHGIKNYKVEEIRFRGIEKCLDEAATRLEDCDRLYISFDVDSLDCDLISMGTGTPVSKGFDPNEVTTILNYFLADDRTKVLEVVEVNPLLDTKGNVMAETAFDVLYNVTKEWMPE